MSFNFFGFGRKRRTVSKKTKPAKGLLKICKRYGVKTTKKSGKSRIYKSTSVLKKLCAKKIRKIIKMRFGKKSAFGKRRRVGRPRSRFGVNSRRAMVRYVPPPPRRTTMPMPMSMSRTQRLKRHLSGNWGKYLGGAAGLGAAVLAGRYAHAGYKGKYGDSAMIGPQLNAQSLLMSDLKRAKALGSRGFNAIFKKSKEAAKEEVKAAKEEVKAASVLVTIVEEAVQDKQVPVNVLIASKKVEKLIVNVLKVSQKVVEAIEAIEEEQINVNEREVSKVQLAVQSAVNELEKAAEINVSAVQVLQAEILNIQVPEKIKNKLNLLLQKARAVIAAQKAINANFPLPEEIQYAKRAYQSAAFGRYRFGNGGNPSLGGSMGYEFCSNGGGVLGANSTGLFPSPCMSGMGPASAFGYRKTRRSVGLPPKSHRRVGRPRKSRRSVM